MAGGRRWTYGRREPVCSRIEPSSAIREPILGPKMYDDANTLGGMTLGSGGRMNGKDDPRESVLCH